MKLSTIVPSASIPTASGTVMRWDWDSRIGGDDEGRQLPSMLAAFGDAHALGFGLTTAYAAARAVQLAFEQGGTFGVFRNDDDPRGFSAVPLEKWGSTGDHRSSSPMSVVSLLQPSMLGWVRSTVDQRLITIADAREALDVSSWSRIPLGTRASA
jgi:hypothetical protein